MIEITWAKPVKDKGLKKEDRPQKATLSLPNYTQSNQQEICAFKKQASVPVSGMGNLQLSSTPVLTTSPQLSGAYHFPQMQKLV